MLHLQQSKGQFVAGQRKPKAPPFIRELCDLCGKIASPCHVSRQRVNLEGVTKTNINRRATG